MPQEFTYDFLSPPYTAFPSADSLFVLQLAFILADGGHDIHTQLDLSGEPLIPDLRETFTLKPPMDLLEYQDLTLQGLEYEAKYSDYWNSTADDDGRYTPHMVTSLRDVHV